MAAFLTKKQNKYLVVLLPNESGSQHKITYDQNYVFESLNLKEKTLLWRGNIRNVLVKPEDVGSPCLRYNPCFNFQKSIRSSHHEPHWEPDRYSPKL